VETPTAADDFETAKAIADKLAGLQPDHQKRILRWVGESLGLVEVIPPAAPARHSPPGGGQDQPGNANIKTFTDQKKPKSDVQFAAVAAYYYRFEAPAADRRDTIDSELVQQATRLAGRQRLGRPSKTLNNAKQLGYLDGAGDGRYKINSVGENLVAMTLPGTGNDSIQSGSRRPKKASSGNGQKSGRRSRVR